MHDEDLARALYHLLSDRDLIKHHPKFESMAQFRAKKIRELSHTIRLFRERIQNGIQQVITFPILSPEESAEFESKISVPLDDPQFWRAFGEGESLASLLHIPFSMLTKIFDHAMMDINLGFSSTAINELYLLTLLEPIVSQFWLGVGIASLSLEENELASTHFIRAVMLSQSDRDALIATLWLIDALRATHHLHEAKQAKEVAEKLISEHAELEEFREVLANK